MPRKRTPESGVLRACLDLLEAEKIWAERRNTGAFRDGKRFVRFGKPGTPDIFALWPTSCKCGEPKTVPLWIECKSATGKQSLKQLMFQRGVEEVGDIYLLIRDVSELQEWLRVTR